MTLNNHINNALEHITLSSATKVNTLELIHCLDLTLLQNNSSKAVLQEYYTLAQHHNVAALCIYPSDLHHIPHPSSICLATVINFPQGTGSIESCLQQIEQAQNNGATEIDYVFPYTMYLEGKRQEALAHAVQITNYCHLQQLKLKVIIETGAFSNNEDLYKLALALIELNVNFLKTSTGKIHQGASFAHVFTLLSALKESQSLCGLKISGGIKTTIQAQHYAFLAEFMMQQPITKQWFRIGASTLLHELTSTRA